MAGRKERLARKAAREKAAASTPKAIAAAKRAEQKAKEWREAEAKKFPFDERTRRILDALIAYEGACGEAFGLQQRTLSADTRDCLAAWMRGVGGFTEDDVQRELLAGGVNTPARNFANRHIRRIQCLRVAEYPAGEGPESGEHVATLVGVGEWDRWGLPFPAWIWELADGTRIVDIVGITDEFSSPHGDGTKAEQKRLAKVAKRNAEIGAALRCLSPGETLDVEGTPYIGAMVRITIDNPERRSGYVEKFRPL